jgi:hypothetical protein
VTTAELGALSSLFIAAGLGALALVRLYLTIEDL